MGWDEKENEDGEARWDGDVNKSHTTTCINDKRKKLGNVRSEIK